MKWTVCKDRGARGGAGLRFIRHHMYQSLQSVEVDLPDATFQNGVQRCNPRSVLWVQRRQYTWWITTVGATPPVSRGRSIKPCWRLHPKRSLIVVVHHDEIIKAMYLHQAGVASWEMMAASLTVGRTATRFLRCGRTYKQHQFLGIYFW